MESDNPMMHLQNKIEFQRIITQTAQTLGFEAYLIEKDYYLTLLLSKIGKFSSKLAFKGGTCLNKIYFDYHRLSEDLDFTLIFSGGKGSLSRKERSEEMRPIKNNLKIMAEELNLTIDNIDSAGHNESTMYNFHLFYDSAVLNKMESIKLDISLRGSPISKTDTKEIKHKFVNQFNEPLIKTGTIKSLSLKELIAEKMTAAISRKQIAPRDFYDLDYLICSNFQFKDKEFLDIFKQKLSADNLNANINQYAFNLGRNNQEISVVKNDSSNELRNTLNIKESKNYNANAALNRINNTMKDLIELDIEKTAISKNNLEMEF